jgi:hypothetical protein
MFVGQHGRDRALNRIAHGRSAMRFDIAISRALAACCNASRNIPRLLVRHRQATERPSDSKRSRAAAARG